MHFEFVMYWNGESFVNTQKEISKWTKELPFWLKITFASWKFELNTAFVYCWLLFMSLFDAESECIHFSLNMQCTVRNCKRKIVQKLSQIEWLGKQYANVQHRWFNGLVSSIVRVWISKMNENAYLKISHNNFIDTQWRVNGCNAICTQYGFLGLLFLVLRYVRPPLRLTVKSHNQILSIFLWIRMSSVCCCCETVL